MTPFTVLCIGGSDSSSGAGIQADLKAVSACGAYGLSVVTAVTAQNSRGVQSVYPVAARFVGKQCDALLQDIPVDAVKTGMLWSEEIIGEVAARIRKYRLQKIVVDPVMTAKGGKTLLQKKAFAALVKNLLPLACVLTPNIPEAEALTGMKITSIPAMKEAARKLREMGARNVVIKGGHLPSEAPAKSTDILFDGSRFHELAAEWIPTPNTHGTGCTFASSIAACLARGHSVAEAVKKAKKLVTHAIENSFPLGEGHGPVDIAVRRPAQNPCLRALQTAVNILSASRCGLLIPEVQSNLVYAAAGAQSEVQVAGFPGRIIRFRDTARAVATPEFGASRHIARIVLTVMQYDSSYRSAMNIKYSEDIINACRNIGFQVKDFDRSDEPPEKKDQEGCSLEWGVNEVLKQSPAVPDIIYDPGGWGKEPMVRVLGKHPVEVVHKVLSILKTMKE
ncbi:MAG TPA: bifunctional hydroxymethylpyrimidine kinase/phosphomethylpyrimidine kinase [Smithella sp.]|nr:bifunctional hydroxymethylpyrimidine kinase/phosphomethylpyrimidine kinase [Smithella sp.]